MNSYSMKQCLYDGSISAAEEFGQPSTMDDPLIEARTRNATVPSVATNVYAESSALTGPPIQGGLTRLLLGVEQEAKLSTTARHLYFG